MTMTSQNPGAHPPLSMQCLSDRALDALVAGAAPAAAEAAHLATCERCRARQGAFEDARELAAPAVARLLQRLPPAPAPRPSWGLRLLPGWVAAAAVAAIALFVLLPTAPPPPGGDDGIRAKGTALQFYVQRDGRVFRGRSGDHFRAGDALRFVVAGGERRYFLLVGIEADGDVSAYHPYQGLRSAALPAAVETQLPYSLILDESPTTEHFVGLFTDAPIDVSAVRAAVQRARAATHGAALEVRLDLPLPGDHHWVVIHKDDPNRGAP